MVSAEGPANQPFAPHFVPVVLDTIKQEGYTHHWACAALHRLAWKGIDAVRYLTDPKWLSLCSPQAFFLLHLQPDCWSPWFNKSVQENQFIASFVPDEELLRRPLKESQPGGERVGAQQSGDLVWILVLLLASSKPSDRPPTSPIAELFHIR